jgi:hypothetical protein
MTTPTRNFLGIPIDGEISRGDKRTPQRPLSELEPLIRAVLDDDTIHSFGWRQYTPYFNDGDACVFRVGEVWVRTTADVERPEPTAEQIAALNGMRAAVAAGLLSQDDFDAARDRVHGRGDDEDDPDEDEDYRYELGVEHSLGHRDYEYVGAYPDRRRVDGAYHGPDEARFDRCQALVSAIDSGAFDDVLLESFGDHCSVVVRRDGITVHEYSHE